MTASELRAVRLGPLAPSDAEIEREFSWLIALLRSALADASFARWSPAGFTYEHARRDG